MKKAQRKTALSQQGLTLVELMITASILMGIMALATGMFVSTSRSQARIRAENVMRSEAQTALFRLTGKMNQSRMIMSNNTLGNAYADHLDFSGSIPPRISAVSLPFIRSEGSLAPEKNCTDFPNNFFRSNIVGNSLLFARYLGRFSDFGITSITEQRSLDIYEFKYIYISDDSNISTWFLDSGYTSNPSLRRQRLMEWTSKKVVDYDQFNDYIADSSAANRTLIRTALVNAGIAYAWRRTGTVYTDNVPGGAGNSNIFYHVAGAGSTVSRASNLTIPRQSALSLMRYDQDVYSVAYNTQTNQSSARFHPIRNKVPYFYNPAPPACNGALPAPNTTPALNTTNNNAFPRGFEVMIVGPASGRSVQMRITTVAKLRSRELVDHVDSITAYARDL